jgi:mRNA-degrading endonuclease RelE of RelBE toxin-antitoxin system
MALTRDALLDLKHLRKHEQQRIIEAIEAQLPAEPLSETRNRKPLRPNDLSSWELRVGRYRLFHDVSAEVGIVTVKAIGWKEHNRLFIRGREFRL